MKCKCGGDLDTVKDSRPTDEGPSGPSIRRRRECGKCGERTTTYEVQGDFLAAYRSSVAKEMALKLIGDFL